MRMRLTVLLLMLTLLVSATVLAEKGPLPDTIYFDVRMNEDIALKDTVAGNTDVFMWGLGAHQVAGLTEEELKQLDVYQIPSGSWSLLLNPYPAKPPYTGINSEGKEVFNPFAINEIRFALNFLINRQYIVDEILAGGGQPKFNPATPGQPGTYRYELLASRMGFTAEGDEEKAIADITAAMEKAAELPENKGRLVKNGQWWTFDGEPVTLKFVLRADDPTGRVREGMYIANQVEKCGIKVDRMVLARQKCYDLAYFGDPADLSWHLYTEGWGAGATRKWWGVTIVQMYSSHWTYYPGGGNPDFWNYKNETVDKLVLEAYNGEVLTEEEYWEKMLKSTELGMKDAIRLQIVDTVDYFVANKSRFNNRMAYGLGDGLNEWSLITADVIGDVMRVTQYSDKGSLFMSAWDPVGADGFSDVYSGNVADGLNARGTFESPVSADTVPHKIIVLDTDTQVHRDEAGNLVGDIAVDPQAVMWDPINDKWAPLGQGITAFTKTQFGYKWANFHHGMPMNMADLMYSEAFIKDWSTKDSPDDKTYDEQYANYWNSYTGLVGITFDLENKECDYYFNYNFPADKMRQACWFGPSFHVSASGQNIGVVWEVIEAMARMVAYGSASGEAYSFSGSKEGTVEVDVLNPQCVADIKAELEKMVTENYVPVYIKDVVSVEDALARYKAAINWIDAHGHAYISDGPFYLDKYDVKANYAKVCAFRDETYPYEGSYWVEFFKTPRLIIDNIDLPNMAAAGEDIEVTINVSEVIYPEVEANPVENGTISLTLITDDKEYKFNAEMVSPGVFKGKIPGEATAELEGGSYTIMAVAEREAAIPNAKSGMTVIY